MGRQQILTPSPVKVLAQKHKISILQPEKVSAISSKLKAQSPELIVVAAYGQILPKEILDIPRAGALNIHASLLPKYRGPSPIQTAILNGCIKTGTTLMLMEEKLDRGPILACRTLPIEKDDTAESLSKKLSQIGGKLLVETLPKWIHGEIKPIPQNERDATYTKIIKKEDGKIDFKKSAIEIERQIRAFYPWPGSICLWQRTENRKQKTEKTKLLKILKAKVLSSKPQALSFKFKVRETFLTSKNELAVKCGKDALIIEKLQLEGKQKMTAEEFLRGHPDFIGSILN